MKLAGTNIRFQKRICSLLISIKFLGADPHTMLKNNPSTYAVARLFFSGLQGSQCSKITQVWIILYHGSNRFQRMFCWWSWTYACIYIYIFFGGINSFLAKNQVSSTSSSHCFCWWSWTYVFVPSCTEKCIFSVTSLPCFFTSRNVYNLWTGAPGKNEQRGRKYDCPNLNRHGWGFLIADRNPATCVQKSTGIDSCSDIWPM